MQISPRIIRTPYGLAASFTFLISIAYILFVFSSDLNTNFDQWLSLFCLGLPYALFIYFVAKMLRQYEMEPRLRRFWTFLLFGIGSALLGDVVFIFQGWPLVSLADIVYP